MKRADLVVRVRDIRGYETGYTVQSLHINFDGTATFFCSGKPMTVQQTAISGVDYSPTGATWCPFCDQSLHNLS